MSDDLSCHDARHQLHVTAAEPQVCRDRRPQPTSAPCRDYSPSVRPLQSATKLCPQSPAVPPLLTSASLHPCSSWGTERRKYRESVCPQTAAPNDPNTLQDPQLSSAPPELPHFLQNTTTNFICLSVLVLS